MNRLSDTTGTYKVRFKKDELYVEEVYNTLGNELLSKGQYQNKSRTIKTGTWFQYLNDTLLEENNYVDGKLDGLCTSYYRSGKVHYKIHYRAGEKDGSFKSFFENDSLKREDIYSSGELIKGNCFNDKGYEVPYYDFSTPAEFEGGESALTTYLQSKLSRYSPKHSSDPIKVIVRFVITEDGDITNVKITQSAGDFYDGIAMDVVKEMPKWIPGTHDGEPCNQWFNLPIRFY